MPGRPVDPDQPEKPTKPDRQPDGGGDYEYPDFTDREQDDAVKASEGVRARFFARRHRKPR